MLCTAVQCMEPSFCIIGRTFFIPPPVPQRGKRVFLWKLELYRLILCAGALTHTLDATSWNEDVQKFHMKRSFSLNFVNYP